MTLEELEQLAESGFTAGPWTANDPRKDGTTVVRNTIGGAQAIAMTYHKPSYGRDMTNAKANTALIAAAPSLLATAIAAKKREKELVEALREVLKASAANVDFDRYFSDWMEYDESGTAQKHLTRYETEIKKARALLKDIEQ